MKYIISLIIIISSWYIAYNIGYNEPKQPVEEFLVLTDNNGTYYIHRDAICHISEVYTDTTLHYEINIESVLPNFTIVYKDSVIDGQYVKAKDWLDSFILAMEEFKNVNN